MANLNINKSIIGGRLTADVELKMTPNNVPVCQFAIAVNRKTDKKETDFINCVAWRNSAEFISRYFKKGSSICVAGSIQVRNWTDNNGNKRYATEIVVDEAYFVDSKQDNAQASEPQLTPMFNDGDDVPF